LCHIIMWKWTKAIIKKYCGFWQCRTHEFFFG
jgi:hypothetical protein